jgi:hypothetical protein
MDSIGSSLITAILEAAPHVRLRFVPKHDKDLRPLREGTIDLEIGLVGELAPEVRTQLLFRDDFVGIARVGHAIFGARKVTAKRFASSTHVTASQWGRLQRSRGREPGEDRTSPKCGGRRPGISRCTARRAFDGPRDHCTTLDARRPIAARAGGTNAAEDVRSSGADPGDPRVGHVASSVGCGPGTSLASQKISACFRDSQSKSIGKPSPK